MNKRIPLTTLALSMVLGACSTPQYNLVPSIHSQRIEPSNTTIGEACDGHDASGGLKLTNPSLYYLDVHVVDITSGFEQPFGSVASPADVGISKMTHAFYSKRYQTAACSGLSLKTFVRNEDEGNWIDWSLEIALPPGNGGTRLPADPYRVRNTLRVANGHGSQRVGFKADGHQFVAYLNVTPGTRWWRNYNKERANALVPQVGQTWAKPLPDEKPGRTLQDVMNPNYRPSN